MKLEILLIALLCTVKATGKVNGDLLKIEEGGSGTDNDTLINSLKKIDGGSKKHIDDTDSSNGSGDDDDDSESSGSGDEKDDEISGSGKEVPIRKVITTVSPTFKLSTDRKNLTSHTVVVINNGSTGAAATTSTTPIITLKTTPIDEGMINDVEIYEPKIEEPDGNEVESDKSISSDVQSSGVNFTVAIIVGVVVGAILSILIIVFLVYRLRKKDEGSYSLDEPSSAMLTADTDSPPPKGKGEYFA